MEENNKVIVFEKKEIILILVFVLVLIVTSFTLGIRLGKKLNVNTTAPVATAIVTEPTTSTEEINLKSAIEEDVEKSLEADAQLSDEEKLKKLMDESKNRLNDELNKFTQEDVALPSSPSPSLASDTVESSSQSMVGKYTIQLGAYQTFEEAKQFAEGFTVRGYNPIINETEISGKGTWYRVGLGIFSTTEEARKYISKEPSLFSGQDFFIVKIQ